MTINLALLKNNYMMAYCFQLSRFNLRSHTCSRFAESKRIKNHDVDIIKSCDSKTFVQLKLISEGGACRKCVMKFNISEDSRLSWSKGFRNSFGTTIKRCSLCDPSKLMHYYCLFPVLSDHMYQVCNIICQNTEHSTFTLKRSATTNKSNLFDFFTGAWFCKCF